MASSAVARVVKADLGTCVAACVAARVVAPGRGPEANPIVRGQTSLVQTSWPFETTASVEDVCERVLEPPSNKWLHGRFRRPPWVWLVFGTPGLSNSAGAMGGGLSHPYRMTGVCMNVRRPIRQGPCAANTVKRTLLGHAGPKLDREQVFSFTTANWFWNVEL